MPDLADLAVVMTAHQRPRYLRQALGSWSQVHGVHDVLFCISVDPSDRQLDVVDACFDHHIRRTWTWVNPERRGVLVNPVEAVTQVFAARPEISFAVLAEEDILVSRDVLTYMQWACGQWATARRVLAVCASNHTGGTVPGLARLGQDFSPLVWGTWRDRWAEVIEPTWDRDYSTGDAECSSSGWDWNLNKRIIPRGGYLTVMPDQARSLHIGKYDGVHCRPEDFAATQIPGFREDQEPVPYRLAED